jgi:hypothetical protein
MSREMIVGREHIHGGHRNYDELIEMSGEPAPHPQAPQHAPPPQHPQMHRQHTHGHYEHEAPPPAPTLPRRRHLVAEEPTHERQFPIGFAKDNIAPGDEEDIEVKPQVYFRGERLAIAPTIARYFDVIDIKVGKNSQLAATGDMPGESFSALAVGVRMELDTAKPGIVITLRVRNVDTQAHDFKAVLYGAVLE